MTPSVRLLQYRSHVADRRDRKDRSCVAAETKRKKVQMSGALENPGISFGIGRRANQRIARIEAGTEIAIARVDQVAQTTVAGIQARNVVAATAAQADAILSGLLNALPLTDVTDVDFRAQLKQVTRAQVIADLYRFQL
jgi:hypothetical protein